MLADQRGLATIEYISILCLITIVATGAWRSFGETLVHELVGTDHALASMDTDHLMAGPAGGPLGVSTSATATGAATTATASAGASGDGAAATGGTWTEGGVLGRGDSSGVGAIARGVADGALDVVQGVSTGIRAIGSGVWDAVTHPAESAAAIGHAVTHPGETAGATWGAAVSVAQGTWQAGRDLVGACAGGDAYACSRGVTTVAAIFVPVGAAGSVVRGAGAVRTATTTTNRVRVIARRRDRTDADRTLRREGDGDGAGENQVIRDADDGVRAEEMLDESGDVREVALTRDADGHDRLRTSDDPDHVRFSEDDRAIAHTHPGAADDPAYQLPSDADIDYVREIGGNHAIVTERGVTVINERTRVGIENTPQVRTSDGTILTGRNAEIRNATRVDSRDVRISADEGGNLRIDPLPDSAHPDSLPITPMRRERVGTDVVRDPDTGRWGVVEHSPGVTPRSVSSDRR